ncbi:MAG: hypothetical protein J2P28_02865 [Actinobacteria bacterium]|nr:hypothetical protein [Actinomycetota bacterium]
MLDMVLEMIEEPPALPVDLLLDLLHEAERIERTIADIDNNRAPHAPGTKWLGERYIDICHRAIGGKPIKPSEIPELFEAIDAHREYWLTNRGADPYAANRDGSIRILRRLEAALKQKPPRVTKEERRFRKVCCGLLIAAVNSPGGASGAPRRLARLLAGCD